jgi:tRNA (cytidine/uridine-2'-O-)-methyltransferase
VTLCRHACLDDFEAAFADGRLICFSAHATLCYTRVAYRDGDCLVFGGESRGLPTGLLQRHADHAVTIPMPAGKVRSLNLATAVGVGLYEALRQVQGW